MWISATGNSATQAEFDITNGGLLDLSGSTLGVGLGNGVLITGAAYQVAGVITNVGNLWLGGATPNGYERIYDQWREYLYMAPIPSARAVALRPSAVYMRSIWAAGRSEHSRIGLSSIEHQPDEPQRFGYVRLPAGNLITLAGALPGSGGLAVAGAGVWSFPEQTPTRVTNRQRRQHLEIGRGWQQRGLFAPRMVRR